MITFTSDIMFLLFTCMHLGCVEFYECGPCVTTPSMNWSATAEILRNIGLQHKKEHFI